MNDVQAHRVDDQQGHSHRGSSVELASRAVDGLLVALFWDEQDGRLRILVADSRTGESFLLWAKNGKEALELFHHPFAYAASRGVMAPVAAEGDPVATGETAALASP